MFLKALRFAAVLVVAFLASLMTSQAALDILIIGSSHSYSEGGETGVVHEKPFNPATVATQLQSILDQDLAVSEAVNVVFEDIYRNRTMTTAIGGGGDSWTFDYRCYSLAQYFMWPEGKADRMTNLRGMGTTAWDYIVLCGDPYVMANFPGMYAEGVKLIQGEVSQGSAQLVLLGQWPENSSGFTAAQFNEIVHRVGDSAGIAIAPAGKAWDGMGPAGLNIQDGSTNHPTPKGEYLAAASIYSKLYDRSAKSSAYSYPSDGVAIADHALSVTQAASGAAQYSGVYSGSNPFQMKYVRKRHLDYSERGTSTEDGIVNGLNDAFGVCRMTSAKFSVAIPVDFHFSRGSDIFEPDKQYLVNPALFDRSYGFPMQDHGETGLVTMIYGIDKRFDNGTAFTNGTDLGVAYSMIREGEVEPAYDVRTIPMRLMWSKMHHQHPTLVHGYRNPVSDLWHISDEMERAMGAFLLTLNTGRCPLEDEPADNTTTEWQRWYGKKIGYETAWQMSHLTTRVPGFQVLPTAADANVVTPGTSQTLSVRFRYPPASDVTVSMEVDDVEAGAVSPATLIFTPANYDTPQVVTVSAAAGNTSGTFPFTVGLATTSDDEVFNGHGDVWDFESERKFAQLSKTASTVAENGGTDTFTIALNWQPDTDVVLDVSSSATGETTVSPAALTFTNGNWNTPQTVTITGVDDDVLATDTATISIAVNDALSDDVFDGQPDQTVAVTCTNDDVAGFTLSKTTAPLAENGGTDSFTVVLDAKPVSDVVIELTSANPLEAAVSPASLTFSPGNWDSPRAVTLTGVNDFVLGNDAVAITVSIDPASSDNDFDAVFSQTVTVTCMDDEVTGSEGSNTPPAVTPIANRAINLGAVDPGAPTSDLVLVSETFGGSNSVSLAGTTAETFEVDIVSVGGSGTWAGSTNIKADGYMRGNNAKVTYLKLGSYVNDAKGSADAKFELTATLTQPTEGSGYNFLTFTNSSSPTSGTDADAALVASIGYAKNGALVLSAGPGMGSLMSAGTFSGTRTFTIGLDFSPTYYNGSTTYGRITWSDSVAGVLATQDLTIDLSILSLAIVADGTLTGSRTTNTFSALSLTKSAASSSASTTLSGSVSDPENNPLTLAWSVVNKPVGSEVTFGNSGAPETGVTFTAVGDYTLRLTATDNWGASDFENFTVTVVSSDTPIVSVTASDAVASESGPDAGQWTVTRSGSTDASLDVAFSLSGSATLISDYTTSASSPVTIPAGQSSVTITLTPVDDSDVESGGEVATLTIDTGTAYSVGNPSSAGITIADDDEAVAVTSNHAVPHAWLDGINAAWSSHYEAAALTDHDGDGIPTWKEYWTGTDPLDRSSVFKIDSITIDGTEVVLAWQHAEVGASIPDILIQASPDLNSDAWVTVGSYSPVDGINSVRMAAPPTRTFYRLAVPSTP